MSASYEVKEIVEVWFYKKKNYESLKWDQIKPVEKVINFWKTSAIMNWNCY